MTKNLVSEAALRIQHLSQANSAYVHKSQMYVRHLERLAATLDKRKLLALRLEIPGSVWDDAIKPILDALDAADRDLMRTF